MTAREHSDTGKSQEQKILWLLQSSWPGWVPSFRLAQISLQYGARIFSARRRGFLIENRVRVVDGKRHGEFRLGPRPIPASAELRRSAEPSPGQGGSPSAEPGRIDRAREWIAGGRAEPEPTTGSLFPDLARGRYPD